MSYLPSAYAGGASVSALRLENSELRGDVGTVEVEQGLKKQAADANMIKNNNVSHR